MSMLPQHIQFLTAVLGNDGAIALQKAADRSEDLGNALVPRAILSWLNAATKYDFDGAIPGVTNTYVSFSKSEKGFSGSIDLHGENYAFKDASIFHLAASVATAISVNDISTGARSSEIEKLGRSVDLLAKTRILSDALSKAEKEKQEKSYECQGKDECTDTGCITRGHVLEKNKDSHGGAASKGAAASAVAPAMPLPPTAVQPEQPRITAKLPKLPGSAQVPKVAKSMTVNITKSEADKGCSMCGKAQFIENEFKGCICLRALAKNSVVNMDEYGYIVKLGEEWSKDEIFTLFECIGRIK